jgi:hypothetical protein
MRNPRKLALLIAASSAGWGQAPVTLIDNDEVRVVRVVDQPQGRRNWADGGFDSLIVYLGSGSETMLRGDGTKSTLQFERGDVRWNPAGAAYTTELRSANPVPMVVITLKKTENDRGPGARRPPSALDPLKVAEDQYSLILENSRLRVSRAKVLPGQTTPMHEHTMSRVVVYLTDMKAKVTGADGLATTPSRKAGEVSWNLPAKHVETNLLDTTFESIVVELKY